MRHVRSMTDLTQLAERDDRYARVAVYAAAAQYATGQREPTLAESLAYFQQQTDLEQEGDAVAAINEVINTVMGGYTLRFVGIPDAGTRHFNSWDAADAYGRKSGFSYVIE